MGGTRIAQSVKRLATGWTTEGSEFESQKGQEKNLFSTSSRPALVPTQPPIQGVPGALSPGVNHLPLTVNLSFMCFKPLSETRPWKMSHDLLTIKSGCVTVSLHNSTNRIMVDNRYILYDEKATT
jgi:hypothetical protein